MSSQLASGLDHFIKTREGGQKKSLRCMWRHDSLEKHLRTLMDLAKERKKGAAQVRVKTRHLVHMTDAKAFKGQNPRLYGLEFIDGWKAGQTACRRHSQPRQQGSTIHVVPPFRKPAVRSQTL